jgi:hypothetical protein
MKLSARHLLFLFLISPHFLWSQRDIYVPETPKNYDYNYSEFLSTVRFYPEDSELDYPVLELGSSRQLLLEFDDLEADNKNYFYKIYHCNYDWSISQEIAAIDYIDGFQENRFYESSSSFNTRVEYTHYFLRLPNDDVKFKLSGNYLLKVYLNDDEDEDCTVKPRADDAEDFSRGFLQFQRLCHFCRALLHLFE